MPRGIKTGGRVAGTPNKATADVIEKLAALGCDPISGMAQIALDPTNTPELRAKMFAELANYVAPKRKAIEHDAAPGAAMSFVVYGVPEAADAETWTQQHRPELH